MDEAVLLLVNGLRTPALDGAVSFLSDWGLFGYLLVLAGIGAARRTKKDLAAMRDGWLTFFVTLFVADGILKPIVRRARPSALASLSHSLHVLGTVPPATSFSFPSGTSAACVAGASWIWLRYGPRAGSVALVCAILLALTRLYVGVHWPSDVIGGGLLGAAVAFGIDRLSRRIDAMPGELRSDGRDA